MVDHGFTIKSYHWLLAFIMAILLHILLLINFKQDNAHYDDHSNSNASDIIIGLKKLKLPPKLVETIIEAPVPIEPVKPAPVINKQKSIKPKPKPKPIIKSKPVISKPTIVSPQVAVLNTSSEVRQQDSRPTEIITPATTQPATASIVYENKKAIYDTKLSQWLERHKKYPTIARRRNQQGNVTIQFVMNRKGELLRYKLISSSEYESLNAATIKMLKRASPMPVPPAILMGGKSELEYTIPVQFSLVN
ncbi:MAG: energy transducer TonB [Gammaproteobacteria bacterium]